MSVRYYLKRSMPIVTHYRVVDFDQDRTSFLKGENEQILLPSGNQIEDSLENVILALDAIQHIASSVKFPAVSITPLSIYRECSPNQ